MRLSTPCSRHQVLGRGDRDFLFRGCVGPAFARARAATHLLLDDARLASYDGVNRVNPPLREAFRRGRPATGAGRRDHRLCGHRSRPACRAREMLLDDARLASYDGVNRVNPPLREAFRRGRPATGGDGRQYSRRQPGPSSPRPDLTGSRSAPPRASRLDARVPARRPSRESSGVLQGPLRDGRQYSRRQPGPSSPRPDLTGSRSAPPRASRLVRHDFVRTLRWPARPDGRRRHTGRRLNESRRGRAAWPCWSGQVVPGRFVDVVGRIRHDFVRTLRWPARPDGRRRHTGRRLNESRRGRVVLAVGFFLLGDLAAIKLERDSCSGVPCDDGTPV